MSKKKMSNKKFLAIWVPFLVLSGAIVITIEAVLPSVSTILDTYAGGIWAPLGKGAVIKTPAEGTENWNSNYYTQTYDSSTSAGGATAAKENAEAVVEEITDEGMVLLKNKDNSLPISTSTGITLLGRGSVDPVYGGSGSGNVDTTTCATPKSGLESAGFTVDSGAYEFFTAQAAVHARQNISMDNYDNSTFFIGEINPDKYTFSINSSNVAVVFISRCGGEGLDLSTNLKRDVETTASQNILNAGDTQASNAQSEVDNYVDGQHELELSQEEKDMLTFAKANYSKVVVVLNESTTMEVGDLEDDDGIDGIIWAGSPGSTGFNSLGKILAGTVNPSGKTPDLYSRDFTADPTFQNFAINGENEYTNFDSIAGGNGGATTAHFVDYEEGIYVGYRYYETRYGTNDTDYYSNVVYPFGYGLSYTSFEKEIVGTNTDGDNITVTVKVTNTGSLAGKEAVQLYYSAPYTSGGIEKSRVVLGDFEKTTLIEPNSSAEVTLTIAKEDMASYDFSDKNNNGFKGYELEAGDYTISIQENSHVVSTDADGSALSFTYRVNDTQKLSKRSSDETEVVNQFDDISGYFTNGYATIMSRSNFSGTFPTAATSSETDASAITIDGKTVADGLAPYTVTNNDSDVMPTMGASNGLSLIDMRGVDYDDEAWDQFLDQLTEADYNNATTYLCENAYNTPAIESVGKPATEDHDGPQGFSTLMGTLSGVCAYMSEPLLAATFNKDLGKKMGTAIGEESLAMNPVYSGWYGPAMNTHRSPFAGRNFEYYSEDGVLAGKIAAEVVSGAADKGLYAYIKHFALNDQETWRTTALCTWADEQTIREIYLKPFEIVVKTATTELDYISDGEGTHSKKTMKAATAVMSSFNRIGTTWAGGSTALMTNVLRNEWGFEGCGISDFNLYAYMSPDQGTRAGTDMQLSWSAWRGGGYEDTTSATSRIAFRKAYKNMFYMVANSNAMQGVVPGTIITYETSGWRIAFWIIDGVLITFLVLGTGWVVYRTLTYKNAQRKDDEEPEAAN